MTHRSYQFVQRREFALQTTAGAFGVYAHALVVSTPACNWLAAGSNRTVTPPRAQDSVLQSSS